MDFKNDESQRLRALAEYKILDTEPETSYEDITYLASMICLTPISLVSLVGEQRQWFKSHRGISVQETPLKTSICVDVIKQKEVFVVPDTLLDERFKDFELTKGPPYIRFYAGAPLITPEGFAIGALCVIDLQPRTLTSEQIQALEALSRQVMVLMELRKSNLRFQDQKAQLVHSTKLASIGEMAASIAHEINNPLTIINGNVGLLRRLMNQLEAPVSKASHYLESIEKTVHRIDKIIRGMKALSRDGVGDPLEEVDLRNTIANSISLMRERLKFYGIEIRESFVNLEARLECRSVQVEQILVNLLGNSFDAIRDRQEKWVEITLHDEGENWAVKVTDSGEGIPRELHNKIMQPFFTTKEINHGTGLGLSISKAIAEDHGGSLYLEEKRQNTCFVLVLPKKQS